MALFKVLRGTAATIAPNSATKPPFNDGYAYFTPDDGRFYIDVQLDNPPTYYYDSGVVNGKTIYRIEIESQTWQELITTKSYVGHHHRISDIDDIINVQSDWEEDDETALSFIKNKPTILNIGITMDDAAKTMFITSPITNGDGVSY